MDMSATYMHSGEPPYDEVWNDLVNGIINIRVNQVIADTFGAKLVSLHDKLDIAETKIKLLKQICVHLESFIKTSESMPAPKSASESPLKHTSQTTNRRDMQMSYQWSGDTVGIITIHFTWSTAYGRYVIRDDPRVIIINNPTQDLMFCGIIDTDTTRVISVNYDMETGTPTAARTFLCDKRPNADSSGEVMKTV